MFVDGDNRYGSDGLLRAILVLGQMLVGHLALVAVVVFVDDDLVDYYWLLS